MKRRTCIVSTLVLMVGAGAGCLGRMVSEGAGVVLGARGKVIDVKAPAGLSAYRGIRIDAISVAPGLRVPSEMPTLLKTELMKGARDAGLTTGGTPALTFRGEIIHYESGGVVDTAIGPLEEVIIRAQLIDPSGGRVLAEANLIGRSKATTSGGAKNLAEGSGKALEKWLEKGGLKKKEKENDED